MIDFQTKSYSYVHDSAVECENSLQASNFHVKISNTFFNLRFFNLIQWFDSRFSSLQVQHFQETASRLHAQYAGGRADSIQATEREVLEAWKGLLEACDGRRARLVDTAEKFRFFTMVRDLMAWMESIIQQIETQEKPRWAHLRQGRSQLN